MIGFLSFSRTNSVERSIAAKSSWINILINLKLLSGRDDPFVISAYAEGNRIRDYVTSHCDALYERTLALYQIW